MDLEEKMEHILCRPLLRGGQLCCVEDIQPPEVHPFSHFSHWQIRLCRCPATALCVNQRKAASDAQDSFISDHIRLRSARTEVTCTKSVWQKVAWAN